MFRGISDPLLPSFRISLILNVNYVFDFSRSQDFSGMLFEIIFPLWNNCPTLKKHFLATDDEISRKIDFQKIRMTRYLA